MLRRNFVSKLGSTLPVAAVAAVGLPRVARADDLPTFEGRLANSSDQTQGAALVGFLQNSPPQPGHTAVGRTVFSKLTEVISVKDFGAKGDGSDVTGQTDGPAIAAALAYAASTRNGVQTGGVVYLPAGVYRIDKPLVVGDYVQLVGDGGGTQIEPGTSFPSNSATCMISMGADGGNVFGTRLVDLYLSQRNDSHDFTPALSMGVIFSNSMNELCGVFNVTINEVSGTDAIHFEAGTGTHGPAMVEVNNVAMFARGSARNGISCNVGSMILKVSHLCLSGNSFLRGILMSSDILCADSVHLEECQVGIDFATNSWGGKVSVLTASGLGPASPCVVGIDSTFHKGTVNLENLVCFDATTATLILNSANGFRSPSNTVVGTYSYSAP